MEATIAAIATALGEGGIGIVRISGEESLPIANKIFRGPALKERMLTYGHVYDNFTGETIDEVMAVYMKGPRSYTAEDVVEIQCHGSVVSLRKILALALKNGARLAEPGEFTKRAFLNGRLDLTQAEAVIDLIRAKSDKTFDVALSQLEGKFSQTVKDIRADFVDLLVQITVNIDYPDEDIEEMTYDKLFEGLGAVREKLQALLATSDTGRIIKEGLNVATKREYETAKPDYGRGGNGSGNAGIFGIRYPYLVQCLPIGQPPKDYTKLQGIPAQINCKLSTLTGYTEVETANVSQLTNCTDSEKDEILTLLKGGVYL